MEIRYTKSDDGYIAKKVGNSPRKPGNRFKLLGSRVHIDPTQLMSGWVPVSDVPNEKGKSNSGFIEMGKLSTEQQQKIFYLDVGQGDATLIESETLW